MQRVGIAGFRGYSGAELMEILGAHARVEPVLLEHRADAEARPEPRRQPQLERVKLDEESVGAAGLSAVLLATPHEVSLELTPMLLGLGLRVIDLSGGYRLRTGEEHARWYGHEHPQPDLLGEAAYGLPEFYRDRVRGARLVANPGCYPTAVNLALRPLVQAGALDRSFGVICDAKSGVSGAGRKPSLKTHFCEVTGNYSVYSVKGHRHIPEVLQNSFLGEEEFQFTAQLLPVFRGILETIYVRLQPEVTAGRLVEIYEQAYEDEPCVRIYDPGQVPDLTAVQHTNFCDIGVSVEGRRGLIVAAIDNLVKGAAGQAVQNLNLMLGFDETEGLL
jgi:N-acetyl-gamma-glutamyl-phosphate reductase